MPNDDSSTTQTTQQATTQAVTQQSQTQQQQQTQTQQNQQTTQHTSRKDDRTFTGDYVDDLRSENAHHRQKAREAEDRARAAQAEADAKVKAAEENAKKAVEEAQKLATEKANTRVINAELRLQAEKLGLTDLDLLQLPDVAKRIAEGVKLDAEGNVTGVSEVIEQLKKDKPNFFGEARRSTSTTAAAPATNKKPATQFDARTATPEELEAEAKRQGLTSFRGYGARHGTRK